MIDYVILVAVNELVRVIVTLGALALRFSGAFFIRLTWRTA